MYTLHIDVQVVRDHTGQVVHQSHLVNTRDLQNSRIVGLRTVDPLGWHDPVAVVAL